MQPRDSGLATENLCGIGFMVAAVGAFSVMDALIKWLSPTFPVMQILLFRTAFALVPIVLLISRLGGLSALRTPNFVGHLGLIGGLAQLLLTIAYQLAPATVVAPFDYTAMPYVIWFGYIFFGDLPNKPLIVGAAIVIGSGLYILHREARHAWSEPDDQTSIGRSKC